MSVNYGSKRLVVGAHYGLRDWLAQRVTAVLMALFTLIVLVKVTGHPGPLGYEGWAGIFAPQWMKALTFAVIVALICHVWVGMREIWMDYIKPVGLRLSLQVFTIVWLVGCAGWAIQVLWTSSDTNDQTIPFPSASLTSSSSAPAAPACAPRCNWPAPA